MKRFFIIASALMIALNTFSQENVEYMQPPKEILELADYERPPTLMMDSRHTRMVFQYRDVFKSVTQLSEKELRLGGLRIDPERNIGSSITYYNNLKYKMLHDSEALQIKGLPKKPQITYMSWSPDETMLAFTNTAATGVELWVADLTTGEAKRLTEPILNANMGSPYTWYRDGKTLLIRVLPTDRPALIDEAKAVPKGPTVSVSEPGIKAQNVTYQDLLKNADDEKNFETLTTSELYKVGTDGTMTKFKDKAMYSGESFSPDGKYLIISEILKPFSYIVPYGRFPATTTVYDLDGTKIKLIDSRGLLEVIPKGFMATFTGKRNIAWRGDKPATLYWVQALDRGDPEIKVEYRDELFCLDAPFTVEPVGIVKIINRYSGVMWGDDNTAFIYDRWMNTRNTKTYIFNPSDNTQKPKILYDRNYQDVYSDPGRFVTKRNQYGRYVLDIDKGKTYLVGDGFSAKGQFPFVDEFDIKTHQTKRLFESKYTDKMLEIVSVINARSGEYIIRLQSPTEYPDYYLLNTRRRIAPVALTHFDNPFKSLLGVYKEVIKYKRPDGVDLSAILYLPAGYDTVNKPKLPMVMWAYPTEFVDKNSAGQNTSNPNRFIFPSYGTPIYWVTRGYAILDDASFPILGENGKLPNDTYIEQLVANAKSAIDAVDALGYIDRRRVAVGGHSYGGFMTANLLTHCDLFAAGIARSGAYNRTLTPFGFQNEERYYWEAPDVYNAMSPFMHADKMKRPLLLIHGTEDENTGTYTIQSERYFNALKGYGATARLVLLPKEMHSYRARESVLHVLWEQDRWLDTYLKDKGKINPTKPTCEFMENPAAVDVAKPRLSWINEPVNNKVRSESQSAYRICVASSRKMLMNGKADLWDSGKVASSDSYLVDYEGKSLVSGKDCWWRVMTWDSNDKPSDWSEPAFWGMGILSPDEWQAKWIGAPWKGEEARRVNYPKQKLNNVNDRVAAAAPLFRKQFNITKKVAHAKAFVTGLGYFELYINGKKVGDDYLVPNFTNYSVREGIKYTYIALNNNFNDYRVMYLVYDITDMLDNKANVAGAILGDGFYDCTSRWVDSFGSPRFLCQIEVTYTDGDKELIISDETWKAHPSPIVMNGVFDGEIYDANREIKGWSTAKCDDSEWQNAVLRQPPTGKMTAHTAPTDKVTETLKPLSLKKLDNGSYEVDFGKEISGWIRFKGVKGVKGDTLDVKYICESPLGVQKYVFADAQPVDYAPRFTWYVFSKAIIGGINDLRAENIVAEAVNTDVKINSEFKTSNPLFNKINDIWRLSQIDNMHGGVASDCPHRERSPYTGDGQVACATVMHNFDAAAFYTKWIRDIRDAQDKETGYVPNGAPWQPGCGGGVPWGAAMNIMPWEFYLQYGDKKMLEDNYVSMAGQIQYMLEWLTADSTMFMQRKNYKPDGTNDDEKPNYWLNLGDWSPAFELPSQELVHTFYLWYCADLMHRTAKALNRDDDADYFNKLSGMVRNAFHKKFYDAEKHSYGDFGSNVFALVANAPNDVVETLKQELTEKYDYHLNTGIFGTRFLFETLADCGLNNLAYRIMNQTDYPSFGHWIKQGATVTWEQWDGKNSRNHPMFGGGLTWFYRTLAGVRTDENEPGYKHIIVKPQLPDSLNYVYYSKLTPYGTVVSEIRRNNDDTTEMNITVPVGSHATVYIPVSDFQSITSISERGKPLDHTLFKPERDNDCIRLKVEQGKYDFKIH